MKENSLKALNDLGEKLALTNEEKEKLSLVLKEFPMQIPLYYSIKTFFIY